MLRTRLAETIAAATLALMVTSVAQASGPPPTPEPPANVSSIGLIADMSEPGTKLLLAGQVFAPDGATPAPGVVVYAYQTDATGEYHNDTGRVARLHGWAKTDSQGRFEFHTIRPAAYPGRSIPSHIHLHVFGGGYPLQWTPEVLFADDPLLKPQDLEKSSAAGKFGNVLAVTRSGDGSEHCAFNIRVSKETNYASADRDDPRTKPVPP
jgi:protocatechuate 3,4-dioxygenase beta subunit